MQCDATWLWITDPWETLDHPRDTTLRLIEEAQRAGVRCGWASVRSVTWTHGATELEVFAIEAKGVGRRAGDFVLTSLGKHPPGNFALVHYRPDPPVDLAYLQPLQLIAGDIAGRRACGQGGELVNPAEVLFAHSEKVLDTAPELMPSTLVASDWSALVDFGRREGMTVVKPLHQAQSKDVSLLDWHSSSDDEQHRTVVAALSDNFTRPVVMQRYLAAVAGGETRLWFVDGELIGNVCKLPHHGTFKIDMDQGGTLVASELTQREREVVPRLRDILFARRIRLAAVDLIDGWVTDFNFTSPGLLVEMESATGVNLARLVVSALRRGPMPGAALAR
jgi:glutathione synthase